MTCWDLKMLSTSQARASPVFGLYHPGIKPNKTREKNILPALFLQSREGGNAESVTCSFFWPPHTVVSAHPSTA